jgi:nucleotide-binding universal stress UspA family protein
MQTTANSSNEEFRRMKTTKPKRGSAPIARRPAKTASAPSAEVIELVPAVLRVETILVPTDFSPQSEKALRYALAFARQFNARLTLLHVLEPLAGPDFAYFPLVQARDTVARAARHRLAALAARFEAMPGVIERTLVRDGRAYLVISEVARESRASLIIIATHGYTGPARLLLGSTTERVVRHAPCPVLVVRENETEFA